MEPTQTTTTEPFEQLPLARAEVPLLLEGQYRVYSDHKNFKLVQAVSAVEALEASGFPTAFKIERESMSKNTLLKPKIGQENTGVADAAVAAGAAASVDVAAVSSPQP